MTNPDPMRLAQDDRGELADFLTRLSPEQWDAPTLCDKWSVRDVAAHIISYDDLGPVGFVGRFAAAGSTPTRPTRSASISTRS